MLAAKILWTYVTIMISKIGAILTGLSLLLLAACSGQAGGGTAVPQNNTAVANPTSTPQFQQHAPEPTYAAMIAAQRDPRIPDLPFADNPDPSQCGIPTRWGLDDPAWLTGLYEGEMIQPVVLLYDSHLRLQISGEASHGSEVIIKLYQQNPVTDYFLVEVKGAGAPTEGWVPAPFLSFEPVDPLSEG